MLKAILTLAIISCTILINKVSANTLSDENTCVFKSDEGNALLSKNKLHIDLDKKTVTMSPELASTSIPDGVSEYKITHTELYGSENMALVNAIHVDQEKTKYIWVIRYFYDVPFRAHLIETRADGSIDVMYVGGLCV